MEDVLELYAEPYDACRPKVNFDEKSVQLIAETRTALPAQPGQPTRIDYEYQRTGTAHLFVLCEPQAGWRHLVVTERRTKQDVAHQMKWLVDERYPTAEVIRVVLDQLKTPKPASLYDTFPPDEARRLRKKLEFHYTPKHGSWLNMAAIELSVVQRQCLDRRLPDVATLTQELQVYDHCRNMQRATSDWHFTTQEARRKLHRLYPSIST
jgi:hypothetical protein